MYVYIANLTLRKVLVEFQSDTVSNLDSVCEFLKLNRNELIRRGAESAIALAYIPETGLRLELLDSMILLGSILSEPPGPKAEQLQDRLIRATSLAVAFSTASIVSKGREASNVVSIYAKAFESHLGTLQSSHFMATREQIDSLMIDVNALINLIGHLSIGTAPRPNWPEAPA